MILRGSAPGQFIAYNDYRDDDDLFYTLRRCRCGPDNTDQHVAVVATNPTTTDEKWEKLKPDEMLVLSHGQRQ